MPFQSEKQRKYLWANEPEIARDWTDTYGSGIAKALGGRIPFANGSFLSNIQPLQSFFDAPKMTGAYSKAHNIAGDYPSTNGGSYEKQGLSSDVRHTLGASAGKDAFIDYISQFGVEPTGKIANLFGNLGITGATALHEIPDAWNIGKHAFKKGDYGAITSGDFLTQPWEDVKANLNVWDIPYGSTQEKKLSQIPTLKTINPFEATRLDDDDETGTIAFDPNNPQVNRSMFFNPYSALGIGAPKGGVALKNYLRNMFISKVAGKSISKYTKPFLKRQMMKFAGVDPRARVAFKHKDQGYQYDPTLRTVFKEEIGGAESKIKPPTRKTYVSPARPHGGGGGGGQPGSMPTGTAGQNPWGRAKGGLAGLWPR